MITATVSSAAVTIMYSVHKEKKALPVNKAFLQSIVLLF